ncbi:tyrosine-type recombinase/integrase [Undibacterium sp. 14-3-2]|uniref:tyrosine-type recombinase/integrase n=1 Tax=Undibacterium sp. 14-3-2 TaxID=2800129 RepID=UPI001F1F5842|nr:tyrosine-type recombinase/integrase [Undibacterium sp. 14-3-2]
MPLQCPETRMYAGDSVKNHAPESSKKPAPKRGISDFALRSLKATDRPHRFTIGNGLYLEVMPSGSKLWRFKYKLFDKENRFALGSYPETSLKVAREKAEAARKQVKQGLHPAREQQLVRLKSAHEQTNTFEAIAKEWIARKDWEDITKKRRLDMLQRVVFPTIGKMPLKAITPPIVLSILQKAAEKNGPTVMAEAKRTMFGIFELATETFRVDVNPVHRWREALPKNKTQHKTPLEVGDIGKLLRDVEGHGGNHQTQSAFMLMWLTLARPSEVVEAEWAEFDLDAAIWRIPAARMKKRKEHHIPLPRQAVKWLRGMATLTGDRKHLFPHRDDRARPMVTASFRQMLKVLGWSGKFSPHATRTTGSTRLNELEYSSDWIERQLAHMDTNGVRRAYNHADYFMHRATMMQAWADLLDQWKQAEANVPPKQTASA